MDKPHFFLSSVAETSFLQFQGLGPFKFSKKYSAAKHYTDINRLVLLLTHLSFRWTVPIIGDCPEHPCKVSFCITARNASHHTVDTGLTLLQGMSSRDYLL
jgi:hypothetical protein